MMQGLVQAGVTLGFQHRESREMVTALFAGCAKMVEQSSAPLMSRGCLFYLCIASAWRAAAVFDKFFCR